MIQHSALSTQHSVGRRTRIVATIGPATESEAVLRDLLRAGMDVARLNFSHGSHSWFARTIALLRRLAKEERRHLAILQDLQGPKLRLGQLWQDPFELVEGATVWLTTGPARAASQLPVEYDALPREVQPGDPVYINDGRVQLLAVGTKESAIECRVVHGGSVGSHKGLNLPNTTVSAAALTEKDRTDVAFGLRHRVDVVAQSFVRGAHDVQQLRDCMAQACRSREAADVPIIAKIEKHEALQAFDEILAAADGVMVARGDLGVEIPAARVPVVQQQIIAAANAAAKPVITATQMLESMVESSRPTRAEVSDVANAIFDGADAVMLSAETATGKYPLQAVQMMHEIALEAETQCRSVPSGAVEARDVTDAIAQVTCEVAREIGARAILCGTTSGRTARLVARYRPGIPILAITPHAETCRRLALTWGVTPLLSRRLKSTDQLIADASRMAVDAGVVQAGDIAVITAGVPFGTPGQTNLLKVHIIGGPDTPTGL